MTRNEYNETYIKDSEINKIYEEGLYQLCLRINYDMYSMDDLGYIEGIVFNGYNLASMNWEDFEYLIREVFENKQEE